MPTINLPADTNDQLAELLAGPSTQAIAGAIMIASVIAWSVVIWRARVRIRRRIQAAVAAYAALELPQ